MIKLRFWIFALLVVALVVANLFFTTRRADEAARAQAQVALEQAGRRLGDAERARSEETVAAAGAAARAPAVVQALGRATADGRAPLAAEAAAAAQAAGSAGARLELPAPGFVLLATGAGVARISGEGPAEVSEARPEWPALQTALEGTAASGLVASEGEGLMRVAAAPVPVESGAAAILLGWPVDGAYADRLADALGLEVAFFQGGEVLAGSGPPIRRAGLVEPVRAAPARTVFGYGRDADLVLVALTAPLTGVEPVEGYGWELPVGGVEDAAVVLSMDAAGAMDRLESYQVLQAAALIAVLLLAFLWSFYVAQAAYGPARRMNRRLQGPAAGELKTRLEPRQYRGPFRKLAQTVNGVLDQVSRRSPGVAETLMSRPDEDVGSVLGAVPREPEPGPDQGFPFGEEPEAEAERAPAPTVAEAAPPTPPPPSQGAFDPFAEPEAAPSPGPAARPDFFSETTRAVSPDELSAIREESAPSPRTPTDPFAAAMAEGAGAEEEEEGSDATVVAKVPDALLQATARAPAEPEDPDLAHFRDVFRHFLDMRQRLGESAEGVTWEKFVAKLQKNRDLIKEKHGVRSVRFQVYEKNGKAALKATPVR